MSNEKLLNIIIFGIEVGKLGYDIDQQKSYFQYHPQFLESGLYTNLFPFIFKRTQAVQVFTDFQQDTFQGLPPMIADALPDTFGNIIFQEWISANGIEKISPIEQLTYVGHRAIGALEFKPSKNLPKNVDIDLNRIINILQKVLNLKECTQEKQLDELSLLNIFKIGTSAGGARPKVIISQHKTSNKIIAGDNETGADYNHYLVKLHLDNRDGYNREIVEYIYYLLATACGVRMMPSKLIEHKHFATLRYDRQNGEKQHTLTATGLTGWDFKSDPFNSSYENLFKLAIAIKVPHKDLQQLYRRMIFNLIFKNIDDHLKNHSYIFNKEKNNWNLAPAYDLTYALNPLLTFKKTSRALSINSKRTDIKIKDVLKIADLFSIKNPTKIIREVENLIPKWESYAKSYNVPKKIVESIKNDLKPLSN